MWFVLTSTVTAYLLGSIPSALLLGKLKGIDIREHGSGNVGSTNLTRTVGRQWGMLCFLCDLGKGIAAVIIAGLLSPEELAIWAKVLAGAAVICGHSWSVFLRFKGGKGVATGLGFIFALLPWAALTAMVVWFIGFQLTRYVSVASLAAAVALPLSAYLFDVFLKLHCPFPVLVLLLLTALLIIIRHRSNIQRLRKGTESRFNRRTEAKSS